MRCSQVGVRSTRFSSSVSLSVPVGAGGGAACVSCLAVSIMLGQCYGCVHPGAYTTVQLLMCDSVYCMPHCVLLSADVVWLAVVENAFPCNCSKYDGSLMLQAQVRCSLFCHATMHIGPCMMLAHRHSMFLLIRLLAGFAHQTLCSRVGQAVCLCATVHQISRHFPKLAGTVAPCCACVWCT